MSINNEAFKTLIRDGYKFKGHSIMLGGPVLEDEMEQGLYVRIPLRTLNRHGLIAGATGTGKTKTLQIIAEQLSSVGVPSLVMDVKGDLSGVAAAGKPHPKIDERHERLGFPWIPEGSPVEFLTLSKEKGVRLRATVTEFGPVLFSKMLGLNDTQEGIVTVLFKYCDDKRLPLLDLKDFRRTLTYLSQEGKQEIESEYGRISSSSVGAILRRVVELEQQGAEMFFGEPSFDVMDLCRQTHDGRGIISILRVTDIQSKPKLFSTFMLELLAEIYKTFPEIGDPDKPKLCLFIDEAHLIFDKASEALLDQIETVIKLIRSKGVGIFFITQNPVDIPDMVLSQLGLKVQHALRAFTARDRKAIKLASQNFPISDYYDIEDVITNLGIGEALVTALNEKGIPTPLARTMLRAPISRMDILKPGEINQVVSNSLLSGKYKEIVDRESAYEILNDKIERYHDAEHQRDLEDERRSHSSRRGSKSQLEKVLESTTTRQIGRTIARELTRGLLGILGVRRR